MSELRELAKNLTGIAANKELPEGEELGAKFTFGGETYYVTQREIDRVKNLPTPEEMTDMVARFNRLWPTPGSVSIEPRDSE
jgi:hypothetical protein